MREITKYTIYEGFNMYDTRTTLTIEENGYYHVSICDYYNSKKEKWIETGELEFHDEDIERIFNVKKVQPTLEDEDENFIKNIHDAEMILVSMSIDEYIDDIEYWLNCSSGHEEKGIIVINDRNGSELGRRKYNGREN